MGRNVRSSATRMNRNETGEELPLVGETGKEAGKKTGKESANGVAQMKKVAAHLIQRLLMGTETGEGEATDGFECVLRFLQQMAGGFFSFENERRIRIRFSVPLPPDDWRFFIRFSMIGGSVYVLVTNLAG